MKKRVWKLLAMVLAFVVATTSVLPGTVYASGTGEAATVSENTADTVPGISENDMLSGEEPEEDAGGEEPEEEKAEEDVQEETGEEGKLNFLYLEKNYLQTPDTQNVLIGFGDGQKAIKSGTLFVENYETKEQTSYYSEETMDDTILFSMDYGAQQAGIYEAVAAEITTEDDETVLVRFSETGMEHVYFGVDRELSLAAEEPEIPNPVLDTQIVSLESNSVTKAATENIADAVEEALDEAEKNADDGTVKLGASLSASAAGGFALGAAGGKSGSSDGGLVVVLDPGHDATHAGARANGLNEEELTLKVAQYCKAELEKYDGVTVYMTRNSASCPHPGTTSTNDNANRVSYAQSVGADVYVSIHFNSAGASSANGAEVFYPNQNYNAGVGSAGANLAKEISRKLAALGLTNRGITIRNSEDGTTYPDGSLSDYYGVIRRSKLAGFPAVIVEHAFLTNGSDAAFLKSESNLKKLGVADAQGIISYYNLEEGGGGESDEDIDAGELSFEDINPLKGTFTLRLEDADADSGIKDVKINVWSKSDKSNMKTYTAKEDSDGSYTVKVNIAKHGYQYGKYYAEATVTSEDGAKAKTSASKKISAPKSQVTVAGNAKQTKFTITAANVACSGGVKSVKVAVWSNSKGKDDLVWYTAKKKSTGVYEAVAKIAKHQTAGKYTAEIYVVDKSGRQSKLATSTFKVTKPKAGKVTFENIDAAKGTFRVRLTGASAAAGISSVKFSVWSKGDKSNLKTYTAKRKSDGSYLATIKLAKHDYQYGNYKVEATVTDKNKIQVKASATKKIKTPKAVVSAKGNANGSQFTVTAANVACSGGVKSVKVAVWSKVNGKDDLIWYKAKKKSAGWTAKVKTAKHKGVGTYNAEVYAVAKNGKEYKVGTTTFTVGNTAGLYDIMGQSSVTVDQMAAYYNAVAKYPDYYANTEASTIKKFCQIYLDECNAEGVKAEVAFVQAMKETNFLRFGGDVDIAQFNFAGLGAVGGGAKGESFGTVTLGIRAHVQHLKAYASDEPLKKTCVDPRFQYVPRASAQYVQWLGIGENPNGKGWATDPNYGYDIVNRIATLKTY